MTQKRALTHCEKRWAIVATFPNERYFLGRFHWANATRADPTIRTFSTRDQARQKQKFLGRKFQKHTRVVSVEVAIQERL